MKILIFDDEQSIVYALTDSITAYMNEHCINADINSTTSPTDVWFLSFFDKIMACNQWLTNYQVQMVALQPIKLL